MSPEFTAEEAELLRTLVEERLAELGPEIHHTDKRSYRAGLVKMQEKLRKILEHLSPSAVA